MPSDGKKRRRYQSVSNNPPRGPPGILFTCEIGRESKCRREGLQILQHDWDQMIQSNNSNEKSASNAAAAAAAAVGTSSITDTTANDERAQALSLDEELALLRNNSKKANGTPSSLSSRFEDYSTGCRGTVLILCTACRPLVPPRKKQTARINVADDNAGAPASKKPKRLDGGDRNESAFEEKDGDDPGQQQPHAATSPTAAPSPSALPVWDPLQAVGRVVRDMQHGRRYPSSRFITRMVPVQATCFAGLEEIRHAVESLVTATLAESSSCAPSSGSGNDPKKKTTTTFAIQLKRRICGLQRERIIEAVGQQVAETAPWTVNLSAPDFTVIIEICKSVAGVSVVPTSALPMKNFNLAELRTQIALPLEDLDSGD